MFTNDSRTEKFLESMGVKFKYTNKMSFDKMEQNWDAENWGRSKARVEGAIQEYGALMDNGSPAPAPILWCNPATGYHKVLDGIQRLVVMEIRNPVSFNAYVVETDSIGMVKKIRVFANNRLQGGYQESSEWTLGTAVTMLINSGIMTVAEAAEMGGWAPGAVRDKKQIIDFGNSIASIGGPEKMTDSSLRLIGKHASTKDFKAAPEELASFCHDLKRTKLPATEAETHIEAFFTVTRSKGKQLSKQFKKKLKEFREDDEIAPLLADPSTRRRQSMTPDGKLIKGLKGALTTATSILNNDEAVDEMAECFQIVRQISTALSQIDKKRKKTKRKKK